MAGLITVPRTAHRVPLLRRGAGYAAG